VDEETVERIREQRREGRSFYSIATEVGLTPAGVRSIAIGRTHPPKAGTPEDEPAPASQEKSGEETTERDVPRR
jgi:hypothetical protein